MGGRYISPLIIKTLEENEGRRVTLGQLTQALGFEDNPKDNGRIRTAISNLKMKNGMPIHTVVQGQVWMYGEEITEDVRPPIDRARSRRKDPNAQAFDGSSTMSIIGRTETGVLLKDSDGVIWQAKKLR